MCNYCKEQLEKIQPKALGVAARIRITKGNNSTHWLSLNDESAKEIIKFLQTNFKTT